MSIAHWLMQAAKLTDGYIHVAKQILRDMKKWLY